MSTYSVQYDSYLLPHVSLHSVVGMRDRGELTMRRDCSDRLTCSAMTLYALSVS